jgi:Tfp pilus assembly protein PilF
MTAETKGADRRSASSWLLGLESFFACRFRPARLPLRLATISVALSVAALLFSYGPRLCENWHQTRLLHRAAAQLREDKPGEAALTARELVERQPRSLAALFVLAEATEQQNLEETVKWRAQIARLLPNDLDSQLNLASAALRFGKIDLARQALDGVRPADRDRAAFHVVAGWLARAQGNSAEQEQQFAAAVRKEPGNDLYQFNLAALQIHSSDAGKSAKARDTLERLSKLAPYRTGALRALLNDAVARNDPVAADNFAQQLQMSPEVTFGDCLLCLNFYRKLDEKKFRLLLERVKPFAARQPADLAALMDWMSQNGLAGEVAKWADKLSPKKLASPPVSAAVAHAYANTKNWPDLKRWTRGGSWGDNEYLRLAYQAIAIRHLERNDDEKFQALWAAAEQAASEQPERERTLARLASERNLERESEQLWWRLANHPPMRREALEALRRFYRLNNNLEKLYSVLQRLHQSSPNEAPIAADLARLGIALGQDIERSHQLAGEAFQRAPNEVNCAVTYAFSLARLGRIADAQAVIQKLPPDQLHDPHAAVYTALLLAQAGQLDAARDYLAAAEDGKIYPEEKNLLRETKATVAALSETSSLASSRSPTQLSPAPTTSPR